MKKVSLILTTYNSAENLKRTLETIEKQDYSLIEVNIKDGGSTDDTLNIIKTYAETPVPAKYKKAEVQSGGGKFFNKNAAPAMDAAAIEALIAKQREAIEAQLREKIMAEMNQAKTEENAEDAAQV